MKRSRVRRRLAGAVPISLHARGLVLWVAALATGIVCVWEHVHSTELAAEIEALRDRRQDLLTEIGFLKMECVELSSRERIEAVAGERLGMRYPREGEVVRLRTGTVGPVGPSPDEYVGRAGVGFDGW